MITPATPEPGTDRWFLSAAPVVRALVHLCGPMAAAMVVSAVYNVVNAGFVGSLHDSALLAAVTFGTPLLGLVMAVGGVFGVGGGALVSRLLGASETDPAQAGRIRHVAATAVWGAVAVGAVLGGAGLLLVGPLVRLLGADASAVPATTDFVTVVLASVPVLTAAFCLEQLVRSGGAARQAMTGLVLSVVANLALDVLLILVLDWGVTGVALATGLANLVAVVYFLIVTALVLNHLAAAYGDGPLAAMGVAVRIAQVPEFLVMGVTIGVLPLLAYAYGKGDGARLAAALRSAAVAVGGTVVVFGVVVFAVRDQALGLFSADPAFLSVAVTVLAAQLVAAVVNGFTGLLTSLFQATGRALPAVVLSMAQGVLFVPVVLLGDAWFGLPGIIWALTATEVVVLAVGGGMWLASRAAIQRGLDEGSPERAEAALQGAPA